MNISEYIIKTALLGTAHQEFKPQGIAQELDVLVSKVREKSKDTEDLFYATAAACSIYQRAGWEPSKYTGVVQLEKAPIETLPYFNKEENMLFSKLLGTHHLLHYAYYKAQNLGKIISPEYLQPLLRRAYDKSNPMYFKERKLLMKLAGNRGVWALQKMGLENHEEVNVDVWDVAVHAERREILKQYRAAHPTEALNLLRRDWSNGLANQRNDLLLCLKQNLSKEDEPFLKEVMETDRSAVVKKTAMELLCKIPDSYIVSRYCELLRPHIKYGMFTKWTYTPITYTEEMKHLGLEELSPFQDESDAHYILRQLAESVPLSFWCELFNCEPRKAAERLVKRPPFNNYFRLAQPILKFDDSSWAFYTLAKDASYLENTPALLFLLTPLECAQISWVKQVRLLSSIPARWDYPILENWTLKFALEVLTTLLNARSQWIDVSKEIEQVLIHCSKELYGLLPVIEEKCVMKNDIFIKTFEYIYECMNLKKEIDKLFDDNINNL